ncbi:alpha/beta hydrolase [Kitasatospora paranensis]|uniref:Alpha/beta fold hydrolase n=1 Tax=Kitasatospora paranensis TaxID=258053 RepID=A0ABW2FZG3_9ACTN
MSADEGRWNWLLVPGGPGLGSESLRGLAVAAGLPGSVWLVDLPGDGSNRAGPRIPARPYSRWPDVLAEAARELDDVVMVGHSTGGMFLLSVPELEQELAGMALVGSAPHAGWRPHFARWAETHPIPAVETAAQAYAAGPDDRTLRALTLAAAPWSFTPDGLAEGRALLAELPYCQSAVAWADAHFDEDYRAGWAPRTLPTLVVGGALDRVVDQGVWHDAGDFDRPNVLRRTIERAGHFPWIENPAAVREAFADLTAMLH